MVLNKGLSYRFYNAIVHVSMYIFNIFYNLQVIAWSPGYYHVLLFFKYFKGKNFSYYGISIMKIIEIVHCSYWYSSLKSPLYANVYMATRVETGSASLARIVNRIRPGFDPDLTFN